MEEEVYKKHRQDLILYGYVVKLVGKVLKFLVT
jgi:hypothetical protein